LSIGQQAQVRRLGGGLGLHTGKQVAWCGCSVLCSWEGAEAHVRACGVFNSQHAGVRGEWGHLAGVAGLLACLARVVGFERQQQGQTSQQPCKSPSPPNASMPTACGQRCTPGAPLTPSTTFTQTHNPQDRCHRIGQTREVHVYWLSFNPNTHTHTVAACPPPSTKHPPLTNTGPLPPYWPDARGAHLTLDTHCACVPPDVHACCLLLKHTRRTAATASARHVRCTSTGCSLPLTHTHTPTCYPVCFHRTAATVLARRVRCTSTG
jgi:hypothetical protein